MKKELWGTLRRTYLLNGHGDLFLLLLISKHYIIVKQAGKVLSRGSPCTTKKKGNFSYPVYIGGGGGRVVGIVPPAPLDVNNNFFFLILKQTLSNLATFFFKNCIWEHFDMTCDCLRDLTIPWQPYFDNYTFPNFNLSCFKKNQNLPCNI